MIVETLSVFPEMFEQVMSTSILGRARRNGILDFHAHDLRDWTHDRHRTTDDEIYGGGAGLLMCCPPIFEAIDEIRSSGPAPHVIFFTPTGQPFNQDMAVELSGYERLLMVCGRYEGFDERVYTRLRLDGWRARCHGRHRCCLPLASRGAWRREQRRRGILRRRPARVSPVYAASRVSRTGGSRGVALGQPSGDSRLETSCGHREDGPPASRHARAGRPGRR